MIHFFPKDFSAYDAFNAQAKPYKSKNNFIYYIPIGCILFYFINLANPQYAFKTIFDGLAFLVVAFHSMIFFISFLSDEKVIEICANRYISENMQRRKLILNSPIITHIISFFFILQITCLIIFYLNSYYFYFSILLLAIILDIFKNKSIYDSVSKKIGELYNENLKTQNGETNKV